MGMSASQARLLSLTARLSDLELQAQAISNDKIRLADQSEAASRNYSEALDKQKLTYYNSNTNTYIDANLRNLSPQVPTIQDKFRYITNASGKAYISKSILDRYNAHSTSLADFVAACGGGTDTTTPAYKYYSDLYNKIHGDSYIYIMQETGNPTPLPTNTVSSANAGDPDWLQREIDAGNIYLYTYDDLGGPNGDGMFTNVSWTSGDSTLQEKTDATMVAKAEAEYNTTIDSIQSKDKRFDLELKEIDTEHNAIQTEIDSVIKVRDKNIERSMKTFNG